MLSSVLAKCQTAYRHNFHTYFFLYVLPEIEENEQQSWPRYHLNTFKTLLIAIDKIRLTTRHGTEY